MTDLPTREQRALTALRTSDSQVRKYLASKQPTLAIKAMRRGARNAEQWLDGTHPEIDRAQPPTA